jgi:K+-transporting ATPase KdpF subunit
LRPPLAFASAPTVPAPLSQPPPATMENIVIGLIAAACLIYLVVAVLFPEKF